MIETTEFEGMPALRLRAPGARGLAATFVPGAGMVGVSLRDGEDELLGQRRGLAAYVEHAKTMGLPLLHPWANRLSRDWYGSGAGRVELPERATGLHRDGNGLAIHGLLAGSPHWTVEDPPDDGTTREAAAPSGAASAPASGAEAATALAATLDFGAHPELLASFPFPHRLRLDVALRERTLRITTTVTATGVIAVPLAYGFHPYLRLPGVPRAQWRVTLPALRHLALDARGIPTGEEELRAATAETLGERAFDDAFAGVEPGAAFAVEGGGRRIAVRFEAGFPAAQLFAPLSEDVVCFEPMAAPTNALVSGEGLRRVPPGASDVTSFAICVDDV